jgi:thiamine kinase-like enzyme
VCQGTFVTENGAGPFTSKEEMEAWFDERLAVCREFRVADRSQSDFRGSFPRLVMCHMDLHERNIILDCHGKAWLIDWTYTGMDPAYFETAAISRHGREQYLAGLLDLLG